MLHAYSDHSKAHKVFNTDSAITLEEGMQKMANWAEQVGVRQSQEFGNIEIQVDLPEGWNLAKKANQSLV